jgi:GTP-binding protein
VKIGTVDYAGTLAQADGPIPEGGLPEIAFSGRSNVGKSSLINTLLRRTRSKVARVSSTPGKTQAINFYRVNDRFFLVDLPGFGYAKVPKTIRDAWRTLIETYLARSTELRGVVHLVDCRRAPTELDLEMMEYLAGLGTPALVVLTKMDKLKSSQREAAIEGATSALGVGREQLVPFSAQTGEGRDELLAALGVLLGDESD